VIVHNHNVFDPWPMEDQSVQAIITSPPYWGLRKFDIPDVQIGDWHGQYGLEADIREYVDHTLLWIQEAHRVLRDDGVFFLNLGDTYGGSWGGYCDDKTTNLNHRYKDPSFRPPSSRARKKCKQLIPARVAIGMVDAGWYCRNDIVWYKKGMPDSSQDKFMGRYEMIYMFTKQPHYYFDLDAVRVPYQKDSERHNLAGYGPSRVPSDAIPQKKTQKKSYKMNPLGANPGDVWEIPPGRSRLGHYAMFPASIVERMMKCASKPGDIVVDPFIGSGTVAEVGIKLGREVVGFDLGYEDVRAERLGLLGVK